jgi:hypothetical protein
MITYFSLPVAGLSAPPHFTLLTGALEEFLDSLNGKTENISKHW